MARKRKGVCFDASIAPKAPTNVDVDIVVARAVFERKQIAKDRIDIVRHTEAPVYARSRSSQVTGDIKSMRQEELGWFKKRFEAASPAGSLFMSLMRRL